MDLNGRNQQSRDTPPAPSTTLAAGATNLATLSSHIYLSISKDKVSLTMRESKFQTESQ